MKGDYEATYGRWRRDPEAFWAEAAEDISWYEKWETVLDASEAPLYRWFAGAEVNTCYNALDRHVEGGRSGQLALVYDSPVTATIERFTYGQLLDRVSRFAGVLANQGVSHGDRAFGEENASREAMIGQGPGPQFVPTGERNGKGVPAPHDVTRGPGGRAQEKVYTPEELKKLTGKKRDSQINLDMQEWAERYGHLLDPSDKNKAFKDKIQELLLERYGITWVAAFGHGN